MTTTTGAELRLQLRPYQEEALDRVLAAQARGVTRQLGVAATGLGKTVMFSALAHRMGGRTLVLAHRDELVQQAAAKVAEVWPGVNVGIVKAERNEVHADVVVASVQTLARPARMAQLLQPFTDPGLLSGAPPFGLVVVDEAHHAAADTYRAILDGLRAGAASCPTCAPDHDDLWCAGVERPATPAEVDAGCELGVAYDPCPGRGGPLLLGVTATPDRGDGQGLADLFAEVVFSYDMVWGIRSGYLSDLRGLRVTLDALDLEKVKRSRGDYDAGSAGRALTAADAPEAIVRAWKVHAADRRTLVFTPTVALAEDVAEEYRLQGVPAAMVSGSTPLDERRATLAAYSAGEVQVLVNCAVLTEGYDEPRTDCVVIARPTQSRALYAQMVGRGTRRHPDKTDCLVLDVVGATSHSLVTVPSLFGLEGEHAERAHRGEAGGAFLLGEQEQEQVRLGLLRAEDVELFAKVRDAGIAWVQVHHAGDALRRYHRPLGRDPEGKPLPTVVLAQQAPDADQWVAGVWWEPTKRNDGPGVKQTLIRDVPLETAQGVAEDYVRRHGSRHLVDADAAWRQRRPSPKALAAAKKWRLPNPEQYATAGDLSEALDAHITRAKRRRHG